MLLYAIKEVGLGGNLKETKSSHKNAVQNHNVNIVNLLFENMPLLTCLGMTETAQNYTYEEINGRSNLGYACYHSVYIFYSCFSY
jgi:hypothetical protein